MVAQKYKSLIINSLRWQVQEANTHRNSAFQRKWRHARRQPYTWSPPSDVNQLGWCLCFSTWGHTLSTRVGGECGCVSAVMTPRSTRRREGGATNTFGKTCAQAYCMPRHTSSYDNAPAAPAVNAADGSHRYCTCSAHTWVDSVKANDRVDGKCLFSHVIFYHTSIITGCKASL